MNRKPPCGETRILAYVCPHCLDGNWDICCSIIHASTLLEDVSDLYTLHF